MNAKRDIAKLQFITQDVEGISHAQLAAEACKAGVKWVQLRLKEKSEFDWEQEAVETWEVCRDYGAKLIINDNVAVAKRVMADGVHLGKEDMSPSEARAILGDVIIGGTANTFEDIVRLNEAGVDYIGLGPFTFTTTKKKLSPVLGLEGYQDIIKQCNEQGIDVPIIAIGGIQTNDVAPILNVGVHGVAVSGLIANASDKVAVVNGLLSNLTTNKETVWNH
jgi:thiamine-phosphate pyrophosphorylase